MGIRRQIGAWLGRQQKTVREIIGRVHWQVESLWQHLRFSHSIDAKRTDYAFWDRLRRGVASGYQMAGLFIRPISQTLSSFVLGDGVSVTLAEADEVAAADYTNQQLARFVRANHGTLQTLLEDLYGLGDQFVVVNPDGSLSIPSPDTVQPEYAIGDYRRLVRVTITTKLPRMANDQPEVTVTDVYTSTQRVVSLKYADGTVETQTFANLIGQIPVVHFAHERSANEVYGRPIVEALLPLLAAYEDILTKAVSGAKLTSNPLPVFEGLEDIEETLGYNASDTDETYVDAEGNTVQRKQVRFAPDTAIFLGRGGSFKFASPNAGFTNDARNMLKALFLLILDYTRMPEALWGGAISSSKASAEVQMPPFYQYVEMLRVRFAGTASETALGVSARGGLYEVIELWLQMRRLTDPQIIVAPTVLTFPALEQADKENLRNWVEMLLNRGILTDEAALRLADLVDDPAAEVEAAQLALANKEAELEARTLSRTIATLGSVEETD